METSSWRQLRERQRPSKTLAEAVVKKSGLKKGSASEEARRRIMRRGLHARGREASQFPAAVGPTNFKKANCESKERIANVSDRTALQRTLPSVQ